MLRRGLGFATRSSEKDTLADDEDDDDDFGLGGDVPR